jgi:hypothetical protein
VRARKTREGEPRGFHEAQFFLIEFDPLGERVEVIAAVAAAIGANAPGTRLM